MNNKSDIFAKVFYHKLHANKGFYKKNLIKNSRLVNLPKLNKNNKKSNVSKLCLKELLAENNFVVSSEDQFSVPPY